MTRFFRALLVSAAATTIAVVVTEALRPAPVKHPPGSRQRTPPDGSDAEDELTDADKELLVDELARHV